MGAAPGVTPTMHLILLCLLRGERHGHAVMQEVEALTEGQVRLGPGTLYGSIKKMLATGLIEEAGERADPTAAGERRRYYKCSALGRKVAADEVKAMQRLVRHGQAHLRT